MRRFAYSGESGPPIPVETGPPIPEQGGPPIGAKRRWSLFVNLVSVLVKGYGVFSHRFSFQFNFMGIVNQPIQNGVREGRVTDCFEQKKGQVRF
jgi:hypothetical protein